MDKAAVFVIVRQEGWEWRLWNLSGGLKYARAEVWRKGSSTLPRIVRECRWLVFCREAVAKLADVTALADRCVGMFWRFSASEVNIDVHSS